MRWFFFGLPWVKVASADHHLYIDWAQVLCQMPFLMTRLLKIWHISWWATA